MSDTHMSDGGVRSVAFGHKVHSGDAWSARACDGVRPGDEVATGWRWCDYDLVLTELGRDEPVPPPKPGEVPTCPRCLAYLVDALIGPR